MEGSENCLKSEVQGAPLNFSEPGATVASAHVYQAAARAMRANQPEGQSFQMLHQGGRALYEDEHFDEDACAVIEASGKPMPAARAGDAGTLAWIGSEAVRRAAMQQRPLVCGIKKKEQQASAQCALPGVQVDVLPNAQPSALVDATEERRKQIEWAEREYDSAPFRGEGLLAELEACNRLGHRPHWL